MATETEHLELESAEAIPHHLRVLVVDDMPENLQLLNEVLSMQGFTPVCVASGAEALEQLERGEFHLIIADAMMPSIDGFQLCREVKRNPKHAMIPYIIYTGNYVDAEDQEFAMSIGVDAYVMKFDGLAALMQKVNELCRRRYGIRFLEAASAMPAPEEPEQVVVDEQAFLERHHAIIVKKLEEKMRELESYAEMLARKNHELQASETRYRNLFEHASVGIFVLDKGDGRVLDVNAEGLALLGYSREELHALPPLSFVEDAATVQAIQQTGAFFSKETTLVRKDGASVDVELGVGPFAEQSDRKTLLYALDITEQKRMRQQFLQSEKMAFMGRLAASIAHDIRNPLAAISLNLQYLAKRLPADFPDRGALNYAIEGAQRISKIVENTLNLARVTPPVIKPESINEIVAQALEFLKSSFAQRNVTLETSFANNLPLVMVEAKQVQQVVLNLVQNAIECSPEKSTVTVSTCLLEDLQAREGTAISKVAVVILDRGPGIPQDQMKHLFEPFRTTKVGGTGLGLALSKQIMEKHKAEIRIEPAVGGGTIARLIFPIEEPSYGEH